MTNDLNLGVWNFGHWILEFVWDLGFGIWDLDLVILTGIPGTVASFCGNSLCLILPKARGIH
jgi:hypothetical protein